MQPRREYALGNAALRTGIVGLVGALVLGVGALAGLAVQGGILAGAGWAAFDGAAVGRTAQQLGIAVDEFSRMRYAANRAGVGVDAVSTAFDGLRQKTLALVEGEQDALLEALEKGENQYGATIKLVDRYTNSLGETRIVARDTARIFDDLFALFAKIPDSAFKLQVADALGVRELLPLFNAGRASWEASLAASDRMGTTVTEGMAEQFQATREQIYDAWASIIGVGYELALQMAPHIEALAVWFVGMLTTYRKEIAAWIVDVYQWIAHAFLDFIKLFKHGGDVSTHFEWTRTVYEFLMAVYDATMLVWNAMATGYQKAKPFLDWLAGKLGMGEGEGLTLLLGFIAANLLGIIGLVSSLGAVFTRSIGLISSLVFSLALPAVSSLLTALAAVIGWPVLLAGGVTLVAAYWDDITDLFTVAWDLFKQTFPTMAATLEEAFGPAFEVVSSLIEALWLVLEPILMIARGFLGVFNLLTGLDLSTTQFFATMLVILGLLKAVTSAVGLLAGSLVARLAPAILSLAVGPGAALVVLGVALGNLLYQFLEFLGVARMVGDWIDQVFYSGGREKIAADIRRRDEEFMRQREANGGIIPGKVHPYVAQMVDERRTRLLGDGRNVFGGAGAQVQGIDVWGKQAFDAFNARLNSIDFGPDIDRRTLRAVGDPRYAGMTGTPVTLVIDGNRTDLVSYDIAELERIASRSGRASLSRTSSWEAR